MKNKKIEFAILAEEVLKRLDILDVAENEGLSFRRIGRNYFALCPFHSERTPSFSINPKKKMFYCFSCRKGGNVINLLASLNGVSNGKVIYKYAKDLGLIGEDKNRINQKKMEKRIKKYEFGKKEESKFDLVYRFLCEQVQAYRKALKHVSSIEQRDILQGKYQIYDRLPYYDYLLEQMSGDNGEDIQIEAYFEGEELKKEWSLRISN